jgi:ABC-type multidrug transport system fused ATPase/permease subunit
MLCYINTIPNHPTTTFIQPKEFARLAHIFPALSKSASQASADELCYVDLGYVVAPITAKLTLIRDKEKAKLKGPHFLVDAQLPAIQIGLTRPQYQCILGLGTDVSRMQDKLSTSQVFFFPKSIISISILIFLFLFFVILIIYDYYLLLLSLLLLLLLLLLLPLLLLLSFLWFVKGKSCRTVFSSRYWRTTPSLCEFLQTIAQCNLVCLLTISQDRESVLQASCTYSSWASKNGINWKWCCLRGFRFVSKLSPFYYFFFKAKFRLAAVLELRRELKRGQVIMLRSEAKKEAGIFSFFKGSKSPEVALTPADRELMFASLALDPIKEVEVHHNPGNL